MREFQIRLRLNQCANLRDLSGLQDIIKFIHHQGFLATDPAKNFAIVNNPDQLVKRFWQPSSLWNPEKPFKISPLYRVGFRVIPQEAMDLIASFNCDFWGLNHSVVDISGLIDFEFTNQFYQLEPFAQRLKGLSLLLYEKLGPSFAYIDKAGGMGRFIEEAVQRELKILGWINIFGPPFVERYGNEFLLNLPGYQVKELKDGGIFHQLTPSILVSSEVEARTIQNEIELYCAKAGVRITCLAPYSIHAFPSSIQ